MNVDPHKVRCFVCDFKKAWRNLKHGHVAKWTLLVHIVYYVHATGSLHGWHMALSCACAIALVIDFLSDNAKEN